MKNALRLNKRILLALVCILLCTILCAGAQEEAAVPISAVISVSPDTLTKSADVTVSLRVTNVSGADITSPVTLYDPAGNTVSAFGDGGAVLLNADESRTYTGVWTVTEDELKAGEIVYTLRYMGSEGKDVSLPVSAAIEAVISTGDLQVTRTLAPEVVREGATASVVYELYNAGNTEIKDITIKDTISKTKQSVTSLAAGARKTLTFTAKMGKKDLTSSATITYKIGSSKETQKIETDELTIPVAVKGLNVTLQSSAASANIGDSIVLTLSITNNGNITYNNVSVFDTTLGTVFENFSIAPGAEMSLQKEVTILEPSSFRFTLALEDNTGMTNNLSTDSVAVAAYDPDKELRLTLLLKADRESLSAMPQDVTMTLTVTNSSSVDCESIVITHGTTSIYTIPSLKAGESYELKRDYTVSQSGQFRFTASCKDTIGNTVTFESNTLSLQYAKPTASPTIAPTATIPPLVTLAPAGFEDVDSSLRTARNGLYTAAFVFAGLFAAGLVLIIIASIVRAGKKHSSNQAYDHLELSQHPDYTEPADEGKKTVVIEQEEESEEDTQEEAGDESPEYQPADPLPEDVVLQAVEKENPENDGMGGFRLKRENADLKPLIPEQADSKPAEKPLERRPVVIERDDSEEE